MILVPLSEPFIALLGAALLAAPLWNPYMILHRLDKS